MTKILLTGATGYIGGTVLAQLASLHPDWQITALVPGAKEGQHVETCYPEVRVLVGDLDDMETLEKEATDVDIVLNLANAGHLASVKAIAKGLTRASSSRAKPGALNPKNATLIQVSGASVLAADEIASKTFGEPTEKIWDDLADAAGLRSWIRAHPQRVVDNFVLELSSASLSGKFNTALVFPPLIYGTGAGPGNRRSVQVPELARVTLERGNGVEVGKGLARWGIVHVEDVGGAFLRLVARAVEEDRDERLWNQSGLYFVGVGELSFGQISRLIASAAHAAGYINVPDVETIDAATADALSPRTSMLWGTNARHVSRRAKELLAWTPKEQSLEEEIPEIVRGEAKAIGLREK